MPRQSNYEQKPLPDKASIRIEVNSDTHRLFKATCAKQGRSMTAVIEQLMRQYMRSEVREVTEK